MVNIKTELEGQVWEDIKVSSQELDEKIDSQISLAKYVIRDNQQLVRLATTIHLAAHL